MQFLSKFIQKIKLIVKVKSHIYWNTFGVPDARSIWNIEWIHILSCSFFMKNNMHKFLHFFFTRKKISRKYFSHIKFWCEIIHIFILLLNWYVNSMIYDGNYIYFFSYYNFLCSVFFFSLPYFVFFSFSNLFLFFSMFFLLLSNA